MQTEVQRLAEYPFSRHALAKLSNCTSAIFRQVLTPSAL